MSLLDLESKWVCWIGQYIPAPKGGNKLFETTHLRPDSTSRKSKSAYKPWCRALTQRRFRSNPSKTVQSILDDTLEDLKRIIPGQFEFWEKVFTEPSKPDNMSIVPVNPSWNILQLITQAEVAQTMGKLREGAPSADGLRVEDLKRIPLDEVAARFNIFLLRSYLQESLRQGATTFIPKIRGANDLAQY